MKRETKKFKISAPVKSQDENIEQLIGTLNRRIEGLKLQFNLFFSGELKRPPEKEREDIEKKVRSLLTTRLSEAGIQKLIEKAWQLENIKNINEIEK